MKRTSRTLRLANWVPFLLLLPAVLVLLRKLVFPSAPMAVAPSIVLGIDPASVGLHRGIGALLAGAGGALASAGGSLRETGQHLHKRVACL